MRLLTAALLAASTATAAPADLPRSTPEAQGMSSAGILAFVNTAEQKIDALHSLMLLRHGKVVAEGWWTPYRADAPHVLYSLSKSFTSTGIGLAIAEGRLSLDDTVASFFPAELPPDPSGNLKAMRVRDLLSMSTGQHPAEVDSFPFGSSDPPLTRVFLSLPVAHKPGTFFYYNTPASYMLSAIVSKVTGMPLVDYLRPRLFDPLGIGEAKWDASAQGVSYGGFGLSLRTEDIARFGQLYLQRGEWDGRQVLPAAWVDTATARQVSNGSKPDSDWEQGYGYQFWRCRHGIYRGDGAFGQFCVVMPKQDAVVAITSGTRDLQGVLNLVWEHILPALKDAPLAADAAAQATLEAKLKSLALAPPRGRATSPVARRVSGRVYELPKNDDGLEAVGVELGRDPSLLVRDGGRDYRVPLGFGEWRSGGSLPMAPPARHMDEPGYRAAASAAWTDDDTLAAKVCYYETPFCTTFSLRFAGDALVLDREANVGFGPTKRPTLVGLPARSAGKKGN